MGVTLERVQFKFASIIGELCSEPDILSQFAVWVDLRLAEYKLKGSISLDCSGDTPDPVWLNGILSALVAKRMARMENKKQRTATFSPRSASRVTDLGRNFSDRSNDGNDDSPILTVSPEPLVKVEPTDSDVFPVTLVEDSGQNSWNRKRQLSDYTMSSSVHKSRRLHSSSDGGMSESLMSIIGTDQEDNLQNPADHTSTRAYSDDNSSNADYIMAAEITQNTQREIDRLAVQGQVSPSSNIESAPSTSESTSASVWGRTRRRDGGRHEQMMYSTIFRDIRTTGRSNPEHKRRWNKGAAVFSEWLCVTHREKFRQDITTIPPQELDPLLAEFYLAVRKGTGEDYECGSYRKLCSNLSCYLKDKGYPCCISTSPLFAKSQMAFRDKKEQLRLLKLGDLSQLVATMSSDSGNQSVVE